MTLSLKANPATLSRSWDDANRHYVELQLRRLRLLLKRRVLWLRSQWQHDPRHELAAQVISDAHTDWLLRGEEGAAETHFYRSNADALAVAAALRSLEGEIEVLVRAMGQSAPALLVLAHHFHLAAFERDVLLLCLAPEIDSAIGALYAYAQDDMLRPWPTIHLALSLASDALVQRLHMRELFAENAPLRRHQLVHIAANAPATPMAARALYIDERIADFLRGHNHPDARIATALTRLQPGPLTSAQKALASQLIGVLKTGRERKELWPLLNLTGGSDGGQRQLAAILGEQLQVNLLQVDLMRLARLGESESLSPLLERETILLQSAFFVQLNGETDATLDASGAATGAVNEEVITRHLLDEVIHRRQGLLIVASSEPIAYKSAWVVPVPPLEVRESITLWQQALTTEGATAQGTEGETEQEMESRLHTFLPALVEQFNFGAQSITEVVARARQQAQLTGQPLGAGLLWQASRDAAVAELDDLAQRIEPYYTWRDIVVPADVRRQLDDIAAQVAHRFQVYEEWGYGPSLQRGRGISALFAGPSGTGKTMAAEVLANHLKLALYRIDLASVVNKYIGETEKNMRRVFDAAERSGAILFFDEADALFGKRTDVKDSHDRFANIEINYLLQRMESYRGLAILATNRRASLDRAFLRRLRFVVEFGFPDLEHRRRIWQNAFPQGTPLEGIDYMRLARLEVAGGNIRNIALNAAFLAAAEGGPIKMDHLLHAARREYAKIDKLISDTEFGL